MTVFVEWRWRTELRHHHMEGICDMVVPMRMGRSHAMPMNMGVPGGDSRPFLWRVQVIAFGSVFVVVPMALAIEAARVLGELPLEGMSMAAVIDQCGHTELVGLGYFLDRLPIDSAILEPEKLSSTIRTHCFDSSDIDRQS